MRQNNGLFEYLLGLHFNRSTAGLLWAKYGRTGSNCIFDSVTPNDFIQVGNFQENCIFYSSEKINNHSPCGLS